MKFKKLKLVECTREEYDLIQGVLQRICFAGATDYLFKRIATGTISWQAEKRSVSSVEAREMAYNAVQAVANGYKYLKIAE